MAIVSKKITRAVRAQTPGTGKKKQSSLLPQYNEKTPPCQNACPSSEDIRGFLTTIAQADEFNNTPEAATRLAWEKLTEKNPIPAVMGRVCPHPCETMCNRSQKDESVNINRVEMAIGDFGLENSLPLVKLTEEKSGKNVAIIGSGPAGISAAYQLAIRGHQVTVYDDKAEPGGMLRYGIPAYRLPREVLAAELQKIWDLGVELKSNTRVGKDISLEDLKKNNDAVFMAIGAQVGRKLPMDGSDASNVTTGADFLLDHNLEKITSLSGKVLVIGGGDVAYDAARTSLRLGASEVIMACRETKELMPATLDEIHHGEEEGIILKDGFTPKAMKQTGDKVTSVEFLKVEVGEKTESGWHEFTEVAGSEMSIDVDHVITAISQAPDFAGLEELKNEKGWTTAEGQYGRISDDSNVWAGGDITRGLGLVTEAIGDGRISAEAIDAFIMGNQYTPAPMPNVVSYKTMKLGFYPEAPRNNTTDVAVSERVSNFAKTVLGFDATTLLYEATRCMSCGGCFDCDTCWSYCGDSAINKLSKGQHYSFNLDKCIGCSKCADECPCTMIDML